MKFKTDCFAYNTRKDGAASCTALNELACEGCKFYKTTEKLNDERRRNKNNNTVKSGD